MIGRRSDGSPQAEAEQVELLDTDPAGGTGGTTTDLDTGSSNRMSVLVAVVVAVAAGALVIGIGSSPESPALPPTTAEEPETPEVEGPLSEHEERELQFGVALGDSADLTWHHLDHDGRNLKHWYWDGDSFVSDDGVSEWSIQVERHGYSLEQQPSLLLEHLDYQTHRFDGGRLLAPNDSPADHLLVIPTGSDVMRVDLPGVADAPVTRFSETTTWFNGAALSGQAVVAMSSYTDFDIEAIETVTGRDLTGVMHAAIYRDHLELYTSGPDLVDPIPLVELDLSDAELDAFLMVGQPTDRLVVIDLTTSKTQTAALADVDHINDFLIGPEGELIVGWTDSSSLSWLSTTTDGVTWSTERRTSPRLLVSSGTQLFDLSGSGAVISRSPDRGQTWNVTAAPLREAARAVAGDVVALGRPWPTGTQNAGVSVDTNNDHYDLVMFDEGQRFELRGPDPFGAPILEGWTYQPASGAAWDWATNEMIFTETRSGDELLRVSGLSIDIALATHQPLEHIALARWPVGVAHPEWLVASPRDVFGPGALNVDFVSGDSDLLAIVTTVDGYELYLADTEQE